MKRCEFKGSLPYEAPRIDSLMAEVEKGFAGSPQSGNAGKGDFGTIGDDDDGFWHSNNGTGEDLGYEEW